MAGRNPNREPEPTGSVLVVDDEPLIRQTLAEYLDQEGFSVETAPDGESARERLTGSEFDVMLCDVSLPGIDGLDVLGYAREVSPNTCTLLITAYGTVESAVEAFQRGAADYLMKPLLLDEVSRKIRRALEVRELTAENRWLRRELNRASETEMIVGTSPAMREAETVARKAAPSASTILILGESGTGKELLARAIHRFATESSREPTSGSFLPVNCAAIPSEMLENQLFGHRKGAYTGADRDQDGVFVHAGSGTVFLDEIGELPPLMQAKLLRAIDAKEVFPVGANEPVTFRARVIAATNKDLAEEVAEGRFREDLFYRLNVLTVRVPPLRERREDIPELVEFLLAKHRRATSKRVTGLSHEAMRLLLASPWKGNIRELDNALQRAVILGDGPLIEPGDLPPDLAPSEDDPSLVDDLGDATQRFERLHIGRVLGQCSDKKEAARRLGIGLSSLYRKIEGLGL